MAKSPRAATQPGYLPMYRPRKMRRAASVKVSQPSAAQLLARPLPSRWPIFKCSPTSALPSRLPSHTSCSAGPPPTPLRSLSRRLWPSCTRLRWVISTIVFFRMATTFTSRQAALTAMAPSSMILGTGSARSKASARSNSNLVSFRSRVLTCWTHPSAIITARPRPPGSSAQQAATSQVFDCNCKKLSMPRFPAVQPSSTLSRGCSALAWKSGQTCSPRVGWPA